jgi:branched-chain amino acid transport system ATP-binding protein
MTALLDVAGVTVRFGGLTALSDVTFNVQSGEIVGLIGPNGAGKTTLFNSLAGLTRPTEGRIVFGGAQMKGLRPHRIARQGMTKTFQNTALFPGMSLRDNVVIGALCRASLKDARGSRMNASPRSGC